MNRLPYKLIALSVASLALTACGSSSSTSTTSSAAAVAPATPSTPTTTSTTASSHGATLQVVAKHNKLGTILAAGPKKLTVYLFEADAGATSHCRGECAKAWPPVTVSGTAKALAPAQGSLIGTTTRSDGTKQLTYAGHPLYFFIKDKDDGDAYGEGVKAFGAGWYVLKPSGAKIDNF